MIGKLIKFVITVAIILALFVGACYLGSEVLDIDFCEDVVEFIEDMFDGMSSSARADSVGEYKHRVGELIDNTGDLECIDMNNYEQFVEFIDKESFLKFSEFIKDAYVSNGGEAYAFFVSISSPHSGDPMIIGVGIESSGRICRCMVLRHNEDNGANPDEYAQRFNGVDYEQFGSVAEEVLASEYPETAETVIEAIEISLAFAELLKETRPIK